MNGRTLALSTVAALAVAGFAARRRGSRAEESESLYAFRTSMEKAIGGFPEGKLPLSKWRDGFLSRGVVQEQLDTRGFLSYLAERQRQGGKSLAKAEVIAWLAANPYGLLETWKGDFGVKTAAEQRASRERADARREAKPLLIAHGLSSAEADLLLAGEGALAVSMGNDIVRWDRTLPHASTVYSVAFSLNGRILATGDDDGATLWRVADGVKLITLPHNSSVTSVAFSPDGHTLATGSYDKTAVLWRVSDGVKLATLPHAGHVNSVAFSPNGRTLATGSYDGAVLWRVSDGVKLATLPHAGYVSSVAFSPDGHTLATGGHDNTAVLWRVSDGVKLATLPHADVVYSVAFSPDGRTLATGNEDSTAVLWRVADGTKLATLPHGDIVWSVAFSPDGRTLATGGNDGAVLWQIVASTEPLARALLRIPTPFSGAPAWEDLLSEGYTGYRELLLQLPPRAGTPPFVGGTMGSHWPEPDVLVHARLTLRPIKGKGQALFADEIQSDWHQGLSGRKPHIDSKSLPPAPFADEWEKLMLKRLLLYAAETNMDALVLTDGATIAPLVDSSKKSHAGIKAFYDVKLVRLFESLVGGLGGVVEPISVKVIGFRAFPGVRMTPALRARLGQGVGYWGRT